MLVVAKAVYGFALGIRPVWWYTDLISREEKILQLCILVSKYVMFGRQYYEITMFPLCVAFMDLFSN